MPIKNIPVRIILCCLFTFIIAVIVHDKAFAQASIGVNGYTQNFDGMSGTVLPAGFVTQNKTVGADTVDAAKSTAFASNSTGESYKFQSATDYAIGLLNSDAFTSGKTITLSLVNNTGYTITQLNVSLNYEKYRSGSRAWNWTLTGSSGSVASSLNMSYAADATNTVSSNPPLVSSASGVVTGLSIANGSTYTLTWTLRGTGGSTNGQALGIDDIVICPNTVAPTITVTQPDCTTTLGSITVTAPIGTGLLYSDDNTTYQTSPIFSNLSGGSYNITVKNTCGSISPLTNATINTVTLPSITLGTISPILAGSTSFTIPYSATTADQYSISGAGITTVTNGTLSASPSSITVNFSSPAVAGTIPFSLMVGNSITSCTTSAINNSVVVNALPTSTTWTGISNTNWNNAANWSAGVPTSTMDVVIPSGLTAYPMLNTGTTVASKTLTLQDGATVTITNVSELDVYGIVSIAKTANVHVVGTGSKLQIKKN